MTAKKEHLQMLKHELQERSMRNQSYSIRSFARDLELDSSTLSAILAGKRKVPKNKIEFIAHRIYSNQNDISKFVKSASLDHLSLRGIKNQIYANRIVIPEDEFNKISDIDTYSLLSLIQTDGFTNDIEWISKKLNLSMANTKEKLDILLKNELIQEKNGKFVRTKARTTTTDEVSSKAIIKHHIDSLELAKRKCEELAPYERYFSTLTFPADPEGIVHVKKLIMEFEDKVDAYLRTRKKTEVFKLSIQYYQATEKNI